MSKETEDGVKLIEYQHKRLNLMMAYWTIFASQKKEFDLQNKLMEEIVSNAKTFLPLEGVK